MLYVRICYSSFHLFLSVFGMLSKAAYLHKSPKVAWYVLQHFQFRSLPWHMYFTFEFPSQCISQIYLDRNLPSNWKFMVLLTSLSSVSSSVMIIVIACMTSLGLCISRWIFMWLLQWMPTTCIFVILRSVNQSSVIQQTMSLGLSECINYCAVIVDPGRPFCMVCRNIVWTFCIVQVHWVPV